MQFIGFEVFFLRSLKIVPNGSVLVRCRNVHVDKRNVNIGSSG